MMLSTVFSLFVYVIGYACVPSGRRDRLKAMDSSVLMRSTSSSGATSPRALLTC